MRFKITFRIDRSLGDCLPINYQYEQSAVIYKILSNADKAYSAWLHDNGFQLDNGKHFKLFCYSRFLFEKYRIMPKVGCINIIGDKVEWFVSFLPEKSTAEFVHGLFANQHVVIGNKDYRVALDVVDVEIQAPFSPSDECRFRTLSPICMKLHKDNKTVYLGPESPLYEQALLNGLLSRYHAVHGEPYDGEVFCRLNLISSPKEKLITIRASTKGETRVKGYDFRFSMSLPSPLMHIAYEAGLGEETGMGFGMIEVV